MVLPLLSMLLVGIIYGGITFYDYVVLANAVADGAATLATGRGNNAAQGNQSPCTAAQLMVKASAYNLNQSNVTVPLPTFTGSGGSSCPVTTGTTTTGGLVLGDYGIVSATYPCSLAIPFTGLNLCPLKGTAACGTGVSSCIGAQTTIRIE
jgi:Flp pilus assembly protein TadG